MWNEVCSNIFLQTIREFKKNNIRYFIMRSYEGLPEHNKSKDVDIIIEPGKYKQAREILLKAYAGFGCENYYEVSFQKLHCIHGISIKENIGIHIDLIEGYIAKGYEIFSFNELYDRTTMYGEICVLNELYEGLMILIYKLFGYKKPVLKEAYRKKIYDVCVKEESQFYECIKKLSDDTFSKDIIEHIKAKDFDYIISRNKKFTGYLKKYALRKNSVRTLKNILGFLWGKTARIVFCYRKYARVIAVIAPDGAGKTTFIDNFIRKINYYYVNDEEDRRCDLRHFRPTILPNLGALGEKAGFMEQDTNFEEPHRGKPANPISSFFRMAYYTLDYMTGWQKIVRRNVQYDRFTIFDRYSYDFIVDPYRSRIKLPAVIRKFFVFFTPKPKIVFVLTAAPEVIYQRKQELSLEEIRRQCLEYKKLSQSGKRFYEIDASKTEEIMSEDAIRIIINKFTKKI